MLAFIFSQPNSPLSSASSIHWPSTALDISQFLRRVHGLHSPSFSGKTNLISQSTSLTSCSYSSHWHSGGGEAFSLAFLLLGDDTFQTNQDDWLQRVAGAQHLLGPGVQDRVPGVRVHIGAGVKHSPLSVFYQVLYYPILNDVVFTLLPFLAKPIWFPSQPL